jgi:Zn-dependent M32 family carboxypeptidase
VFIIGTLQTFAQRLVEENSNRSETGSENGKQYERSTKFMDLKAPGVLRVHRVGSLYASPDELLVQVTGKPMDPSVYVGYLQRKYATLYGL